MATARERELARLDKEDAKARAKSLRQTLAEVLAAINNAAGLERLRAITDEEWEAAVASDQGTQAA
jgi:hypothetical protein